ncbi:FAD-binding domain-containing protein [Tothia fuscella]|uniref:FAD-binding domain-containing protein n=1 Tax=Tothia fuscella TaxID=1048955 RepID=A0A9P4TUN5_9PEZI|nr:FAD-binding domain-containing protein [Tothia fuscella]
MRVKIAFLLSLLELISSVVSETCKCRPTEACWPSENDWSKLNNTISGRLIKAVPPASVCYSSHPSYNQTACTRVRSQWYSSAFHAADPISLGAPGWSGNSCPPIDANGVSIYGNPTAGARNCTIGKHSVYVVNATGVADVQAAVRFAKAKNIALVIKNTGHSYIGRNTGFGSLSVWTHWMKNITFHEDFHAQNCPSNSSIPQRAATLGAGVQVYEAYEEADKHDAAIVGGANPTVGVVGWFTGGGHGPLTSDYGMGADNVLEATVVLPSGEVVTANECQNSDLLYAIRGGGGSTYGIIISAVMKAHPTPQTGHHMFFMTSKGANASSQFYKMTAFLLSEFPRLKDAGMQGYFGFRAGAGKPGSRTLSFNWGFYVYNKPNGTIESLFEPIKQRLDRDTSVTYFSRVSSAPSFFKQFKKAPGAEPVALQTGGAMGGWLLPRSALANVTKLARLLETIGPSVDGPAAMHITGHFSAPNGGRDLDVGTNPAWRDAVIDVIPYEPVDEGAPDDVVEANAKRMTFTKQQALRDIAPNSGAYFNECDAREPNWRQAYFGASYDRLLTAKQKYDPEDVLWCRGCVGSDRWLEHSDGGICKAPGI